jgi:hypothetical protein
MSHSARERVASVDSRSTLKAQIQGANAEAKRDELMRSPLPVAVGRVGLSMWERVVGSYANAIAFLTRASCPEQTGQS